MYDSTDAEDVDLPMDCQPGKFFTKFEPAFRNMARWSEKPGAPLLGDASAPWEHVSAFYDFWFAFKSWREFPHDEEEDPETADGREHRRHIERANAKLRERAKKEETAEIKARSASCPLPAHQPPAPATKRSLRSPHITARASHRHTSSHFCILSPPIPDFLSVFRSVAPQMFVEAAYKFDPRVQAKMVRRRGSETQEHLHMCRTCMRAMHASA